MDSERRCKGSTAIVRRSNIFARRFAFALAPRRGPRGLWALRCRNSARRREAGDCFEAALGLKPRRPPTICKIANLRRIASDDGRIAAMLALAEDVSLSVEEQSLLHFALGRALADAGEEARGFEHLIAATRCIVSLLHLARRSASNCSRRVQDVFTPDLISRGRKTRTPGRRRCSSSACRGRDHAH